MGNGSRLTDVKMGHDTRDHHPPMHSMCQYQHCKEWQEPLWEPAIQVQREEPLAGRIMPLSLTESHNNEILPPAKGFSASYALGVGSALVVLASCPRLLRSAKSSLLFITINVVTDELIVTALCSSRSDNKG